MISPLLLLNVSFISTSVQAGIGGYASLGHCASSLCAHRIALLAYHLPVDVSMTLAASRAFHAIFDRDCLRTPRRHIIIDTI